MKGARWLAALVACAFGAPSAAWSASECGAAGPWVEVEFGRGGWSADFERTVLEDLDAGLEARGLCACEAGAPEARSPTAVVTVEDAHGSGLSVTVEVRDAVTAKRVSRDVDLARVPSDGRAFAVALAIDELVWATWAELALESEGSRRREAPPEVVRAVARELPAAASARMGARFGIDHLPGKFTQLGGDAVWLVALGSRFSLELDLVMRQGLRTPSEHGQVSSRSLGVASGLRFEVLSGETLRLDLGLSARAALFQFQGRPAAGARAADLTALGVDLRSLVHGRWSLWEPIDLELGAGGGWPLRTVHALDQGREATSLDGPELLATLGILVEL